MKKLLFGALAFLSLATTTYASTGEVKTFDKKAEKVIVGDCYGAFYVHDSKGNFIAKHTMELTTSSSGDCFDALRKQNGALQAQYGADYKVTYSVSYDG